MIEIRPVTTSPGTFGLCGRRFGRPMVADLVEEKALESRAGTIGGAKG